MLSVDFSVKLLAGKVTNFNTNHAGSLNVDYGVGSYILANFGVHKMGLLDHKLNSIRYQVCGLEIVECIA